MQYESHAVRYPLRVKIVSMLLFLSHTAEDRALAGFLKEWLQTSYSSTNLFVSSSTDSVPAGAVWRDEVNNGLREAAAVLVLVTPRSIGRPWIWFETGASWAASRRIIPLCVDGSSFDDLGVLLGMYEAVSLDTGNGVANLIRGLQPICGSYTGPEPNAVAAEIREVLIDQWRVQTSGRPWQKVPFKDYFLAWDGPLDYLAHPLETEVWTSEHGAAIGEGLDVRQIVPGAVEIRIKRGWSKLFATDCRTWLREMTDDRGLEIMVRPRRPSGTKDEPITSPGPLVVRLGPGPASIERIRALYRQADGRRALEADDFDAVVVKTAVQHAGLDYYECDLDSVHFVSGTKTIRVRNVQGIGYIFLRPDARPRTLRGFKSERIALKAAARYFGIPALAEDILR